MKDSKGIQLYKRQHRGETHIFLEFDPSKGEVMKAVRNLRNRKYSKTSRMWYVPYTKEAFHELRHLPFEVKLPIETKKQILHHNSNNTTGTTDDIGSKGDNTSISSPKEEHSILPDTNLYTHKAIDIPKIKITHEPVPHEQNSGDVTIKMNGGWYVISLPYSKEDVSFLKLLKGSWWNSKYNAWMVKPLPANLEKIQQKFHVLTPEDYQRWMELSEQSADPLVVEIYKTPEHPDSVAVKVGGHGVDLGIIKEMPERSYQKEMKRWIIVNRPGIVDRIIAFYTDKGAKIINRITNTQDVAVTKPTYKEKRKYLVSKYPVKYQEILTEYTNPMIQMRYSWNTVKQYAQAFMRYVAYLGDKHPSEAEAKDVNRYLALLAREKVSESLIHSAVNAIKFYYVKVKFLPEFALEQVKRPKKGRILPTILSIGEVDRLLRSVDNLKHVAILYSLYSAGLRLNELLSLKINDIYWDRNQIFVRAGKGKKDRTIMLSAILKDLLRYYFDQYQPMEYLFNGQDGKSAYSAKSVQNLVKVAARRANINRRVTPHVLRHCFATHLLDSGTDIRYIQELLGHKDIKTTLIYTHVTTRSMESIKSPLDQLSLGISVKKRNNDT